MTKKFTPSEFPNLTTYRFGLEFARHPKKARSSRQIAEILSVHSSTGNRATAWLRENGYINRVHVKDRNYFYKIDPELVELFDIEDFDETRGNAEKPTKVSPQNSEAAFTEAAARATAAINRREDLLLEIEKMINAKLGRFETLLDQVTAHQDQEEPSSFVFPYEIKATLVKGMPYPKTDVAALVRNHLHAGSFLDSPSSGAIARLYLGASAYDIEAKELDR